MLLHDAPAPLDLGHPSGDTLRYPAEVNPLALDRPDIDTQAVCVESNPLPSAIAAPGPVPVTPTEHQAADALLLVLADALDDLEHLRTASASRLRALRDVKGLGGSRAEQSQQALVDALGVLEHQATLELRRALRLHPLAAWGKRTHGIGEKQLARLLAAIGWPGDRATPSQLWQFCGHGDPARSRRRRGERCGFSPIAKTRVYLIAESCMKQRQSPYRAVYDAERAKWADRDTSDAHKHAHALRVVGKRVLLDLWREAKRLDGGEVS